MPDSIVAPVERPEPVPRERYWLGEASKLARELLEEQEGVPELSCWSKVERNWLKAKEALIRALDPETGRRAIPIAWEPTAREAITRWRDSLLDYGTDAVYELRVRHAQGIEAFRLGMRTMDWPQVAQGSPLLALGDGKVIREGMKLTRALGAFLRHLGASKDEASLLVDFYAQKAQGAPRAGWLVLSANILDVLCCSEYSAYGSCHGFAGVHRAGPQSYLADRHTVVAYYYETASRPCRKLPYKLSRQMVHVDADRHSALLMRVYGQPLPDVMQMAVRREVARLLTALQTGKPCLGEPAWKRVKTPEGRIVPHGSLAYVDAINTTIQLRSGQKYRPEIHLAKGLCGACGGELDAPELLGCSGCVPADECCANCNARLVDEDDVYPSPNGETTYCRSCWSDHYFNCAGCSENFSHDSRLCNAAGEEYCEACYAEHYTECDGCQTELVRNDAWEVREETLCQTCALAPLYQRLQASPRWLRSGDGARYVLARVWAANYLGAAGLGWPWSQFRVLEDHTVSV